MNKKTQIIIAIILLIIAVVIVVTAIKYKENIIGYTFFPVGSGDREVNMVPPVEHIGDDMSEWKMYSNKNLGYEIKYPEGWVVDDNHDDVDWSTRLYFIPLEGEITTKIVINRDGSCKEINWHTDPGIEDNKTVCIEPNGKSLSIDATAYTAALKKQIDQILSTFKFTN